MPFQVPECECPAYLHSKEHLDWQMHHRVDVFLNRLDKQQRR
jgi:hypothetical protein